MTSFMLTNVDLLILICNIVSLHNKCVSLSRPYEFTIIHKTKHEFL